MSYSVYNFKTETTIFVGTLKECEEYIKELNNNYWIEIKYCP